MFLQIKPKHRTIQNPRFIQFFSSSSTPTDPPNPNPNVNDQNNPPSSSSSSQSQSQSQSSFSSYFSDVKASLKQQQQQPRSPFSRSSPSLSNRNNTTTSSVASLDEIRKHLSEFRIRSDVPFPDGKSSHPPPPSQHISFQELYKRNVISKGEVSNTETKRGDLSFQAIRESLKQLRSNQTTTKKQSDGDPSMSLSKFTETLKLRPVDPNVKDSRIVIGTPENLPASVFAKEMRAKESESSPETRMEFLRPYSVEELGVKLRKLRPEVKGENWFSLRELNERLKKLRELEEKEPESRVSGVSFKDLRESLMTLSMADEAKVKKNAIQRLDVLAQFGATPNFMLAPPKEQLVEKYFHPDNMSSSEKLKLELQKVRDEFKMSESDCGSARVQVATLTTKIKHLSTALHKKDKHSRKGLQEMVQRRKKLLKYLRRTDWDSYCLVLSKLGLRDNPNYKTKT